uniref:Uncharacterized protein n=1 Tax=Eutreptiella gymnastica TaxID=73025 RepID=A0A7S4FK45_9EUGL
MHIQNHSRWNRTMLVPAWYRSINATSGMTDMKPTSTTSSSPPLSPPCPTHQLLRSIRPLDLGHSLRDTRDFEETGLRVTNTSEPWQRRGGDLQSARNSAIDKTNPRVRCGCIRYVGH